MLITLSSFQRSATFEDSNVHRPVYFYIVKNSKCPFFFGHLYKKKPFRALKHLNTWYTKFVCSNSVLILLIIKLSCVLATIFSPFFTEVYYLSRTAHWGILSLAHSALIVYYLLRTAHWGILSLGHTEVIAIISWAYRSDCYYLLYDYCRATEWLRYSM